MRPHSPERLLVIAALSAWLLAETVLAVVLRVEGYDGYWYLTNARYLVGDDVFRYEVTKAPLVSILLLPSALAGRLARSASAGFILGHLTMLGVTAFLGLTLVRLLRSEFGRTLAWGVTFAFLGSRLVSRYAVFAMSDLAAAAGVLLALLAIHRDHALSGWRRRLPFAGAVAVAILARYPAGLVLPAAVLWDLITTTRSTGWRQALHRLGEHAAAQAAGMAALLAVHLVVYARPFGAPDAVLAALGEMVQRNARLGGISVRGLEPWWEYAPMLVLACTLPAVLLMLYGMAVGLRRGGRRESLHALWVFVSLGFISLVSSHKEARYILPTLPSLFLFLAWGLRGLGGWTAFRRLPYRGPLAIAFLLAVGGMGMAREATILAQPFFRTPVQAMLARQVDEAAPAPRQLAWVGNFYPLVPPRHVFTKADEYYYVYHLAPHVLEYYLGRPVQSLRHLQSARAGEVLLPLGSGSRLGDGDALLSGMARVTVTASLPQPVPPLMLSLLRQWNLTTVATEEGMRVLQAAADPVSARIDREKVIVRCQPGLMEIVLRQRSGLSRSLGLHDARKGSVEVPLPEGWTAATVHSMQVLHFSPQPLSMPW